MIALCPRCRQPVLPDDTSCWQCGAPLAAADPSTDPAAAAPARLSPFAVYSAVTLVLVLLALVLLRQLGRQPLLQIVPGYARPAGWVTVTPPDRAFTLDLPPTWGQASGPLADSGGAPLLKADLVALAYPLVAPPVTATVVWAAWSGARLEDAAARLVIVRDEALVGLDLETAAARAEATDLAALNATVVDDFARSHVSLLLEMTRPNWGRQRCRQQIYPATALVVAVCGTPERFRFEAQTVETILQSFQPLVSPD